MHKILFLLLSASVTNYSIQATDAETFRVVAEVLNAEQLKKYNLLPSNTKNGDHVYIIAPRNIHEILIGYNWVDIRYFYHPDGKTERIFDNKIECWK